MTFEDATGHRETIGERLAGLIPTEIEQPAKPGEGYKRAIGGNSVRFKCRQCKSASAAWTNPPGCGSTVNISAATITGKPVWASLLP